MKHSIRWDPGALVRANVSRIYKLAKFVRIEHTLFSLPFAYAGALLSDKPLTVQTATLIFTALLGLRMAGISFNNIADRDIDALNPRTAKRPLVVGIVSLREAWGIVVVGSLLYYISAALLNIYALMLSPIVWAITMSYPYAKRFHWLPHIHLGFVLGLAVFGGYVAVEGCYAQSILQLVVSAPWPLILGVTLWVSGFDTVYAIMDIEFDRKLGLGSIPAKLGVKGALVAALVQHAIASLLFVYTVTVYGLGFPAYITTVASIVLLCYEDYLVLKSHDNIPRAFNLNLVIGPLYTLGIILSEVLKS